MTIEEMNTYVWRNQVWQASTLIFDAWINRQVRRGLKTDVFDIDSLPARLGDLLTDLLKGGCDPSPEDVIPTHVHDFRRQPQENKVSI